MASHQLELRRAVLADLPACVALLGEVVLRMNAEGNFQWDEKYPLQQHLLADIEKGHFWVAELADAIVGFAALTMDQGADYAQCFNIDELAIVPHRIAVSPAARGKGVASAFFAQAEKLAEVAETISRRYCYS